MADKSQKPTIPTIDEAFDKALQEAGSDEHRPQKRRRTKAHADALAGGFLLDDEQATEAPTAEEIPLSLIPHALQILGLPPDDVGLMRVFRNAAFEQRDNSPNDPSNDVPEMVVSKEDWRSVCLTLFPDAHDENDDAEEMHAIMSTSTSSDDGDSAEEYVPEGARRPKPLPRKRASRRSVKRQAERDSDASAEFRDEGVGKQKLTARQRSDALSTFELFFPSLPKDRDGQADIRDDLNKRLTVEDLEKASKSVREKIPAEEIIEMISFFSTQSSPKNPTLSFEDFQQLLLTAKLI